MEKLGLIYSETYNFVYLRAKSILKKEEEIYQLMKELYVKAADEHVDETNMYEWLGNQIYMLGCGKYRKKKAREAELIEWDELKKTAKENIDRDKTKEVLCESLDALPDLYQATLYAFYYDYMKIEEIATVMGYGEKVIINRLNYIHKYLSKALENHKEEHQEEVQFSLEMLCEALSDWSKEQKLSATIAQNIYLSVCRELGVQAENICEENMVAGAENRIRMCDGQELQSIYEELQAYSEKRTIDKKKLILVGCIGALVSLAIFAIFIIGNDPKKEKSDKQPPVVEKEAEIDTETDAETESESEPEVEPETESKYILPDSDSRKLTRADLEGLSKEQLRLARNEIFARHGMIFGEGTDLDEYFDAQSWYEPTVPQSQYYDVVEMNSYEEANLVLILDMEEEME